MGMLCLGVLLYLKRFIKERVEDNMRYKLKVRRYLQKPKLHGMKDQQLVSLRYFTFLYLNNVIDFKNIS